MPKVSVESHAAHAASGVTGARPWPRRPASPRSRSQLRRLRRPRRRSARRHRSCPSPTTPWPTRSRAASSRGRVRARARPQRLPARPRPQEFGDVARPAARDATLILRDLACESASSRAPKSARRASSRAPPTGPSQSGTPTRCLPSSRAARHVLPLGRDDRRCCDSRMVGHGTGDLGSGLVSGDRRARVSTASLRRRDRSDGRPHWRGQAKARRLRPRSGRRWGVRLLRRTHREPDAAGVPRRRQRLRGVRDEPNPGSLSRSDVGARVPPRFPSCVRLRRGLLADRGHRDEYRGDHLSGHR